MDIIQTLSDLIKFKTYDGNKSKTTEVDNLYSYVLKNIDTKSFKHKVVQKNGHKSLIIYNKSLENPEVVLQSHIDVVPAKDNMFEAVIKNNRLIGRGASDMKFAAASFIDILNSVDLSDKDLAVWLTSDEELGGEDGVNYLLNGLNFRSRFCFLPDGASNTVVTKAKGVLHFSLSAHGKAAHGSEPWAGDNAIEKLFAAFEKLKSHQIFKRKSDQFWVSSINLGKISGGNATNAVPDFAKAYIDFRYKDHSDYDLFMKHLDKLCKDSNLDFEKVVYGSSFELDLKDPKVRLFMNELDNKKVEYEMTFESGSSDARFFAEKSINTLTYNPIGGAIHSDDEWIDINSFRVFNEVAKNWVKKS